MNLTTSIEDQPSCGPVSELLSRIGDKWTVQVVVSLRENPRRFNDIKRYVKGISQQMLTRTLRGLERDGLVTRTVIPANPPQVEYALTSLGGSLSEPLGLLANWARIHIATIHHERLKFDERTGN